MNYSQMNDIQKIIRNHGVKDMDDFDNRIDEFEQNQLVLALQDYFYEQGERFLDDWEVLSEHKEQLLAEHLELDGNRFLMSVDRILIPLYREIIAKNIYVPFEGEEEENDLANLADDKYNYSLETPY